MTPGSRPGLLAALVVTGLVASVGLQVARERQYAAVGSPIHELYFTSGDSVGTLALSFRSVLADVYWIRAIQYFAATRLEQEPPGPTDLLYPLLDITTTLDPRFTIAYRFGAIFLAEGLNTGLGRPALSIKLLDKGFARNPDKWEYLYDKAFVYYWSLRNPHEAAHWFDEAAKVPGSADWLPGLAGYMLAQGGDRRSSRFLFQQILRTAEHQYMRTTAEWRLGQLDTLDILDQLNAMLDRQAQLTGSRASSWQPLIDRGWLRTVPTDPAGKALIIEPSGRATVDPTSKYYPLPDEPPPFSRPLPPGAPSPAPQNRPR